MSKRWLVLAGLLCCVLGSTANALEQQELDDVMVTATRTERKTEDISAGVSVVPPEQIENSRMIGIKEALQGLPGVQSETKNGGYDSRLIIRGAGLKAQYGVREIMIMLDGVPITDPDGMSRLDFVDTQLVERIDVVRGPNSTLYGANAAGGIINIITKNPYEEIKSAKVGYGSDNTQLYNVILGSHYDKTYATASGTRKSTNGWRQWNEFDTNQASLKIGHQFDDKTSLDFNFSYTEANIQLPGTLTQAQFNSDPSQLTSEPWKNSGRYSHIYSTNLKLDKDFGPVRLKPLVYFQRWDHYHPVTGLINDGGANIYGTDIQNDWKHTLFGVAGTLTSGVAAQIDLPSGSKYAYRDVKTLPTGRITSTLSDAKGALSEIDSETVSKWGVYLQESLQPAKGLIVDAGIRFDQVLFDINEDQFLKYDYAAGKYVTSRVTTNVNKNFDYVSPRIGATYKLADIYSLYGTFSTGFQTPQSSELADNPDLNPAKTFNYEIGGRLRHPEGHTLDLSLFYMHVTDEIVQNVENTQTVYTNAGTTNKLGVELAGRYQVMPGFHVGGAYTYSDFTYGSLTEVISGVSYSRDGNQLPYVPRTQWNLNAFYRHPSGFKAKVDTNSWGKYYVDNANSATYPGYWFVTNLMVGFEKSGWDITFDVANLFDRQYAMEVTKDSSTKALRYRPGAPISYFGKVSYKF